MLQKKRVSTFIIYSKKKGSYREKEHYNLYKNQLPNYKRHIRSLNRVTISRHVFNKPKSHLSIITPQLKVCI